MKYRDKDPERNTVEKVLDSCPAHLMTGTHCVSKLQPMLPSDTLTAAARSKDPAGPHTLWAPLLAQNELPTQEGRPDAAQAWGTSMLAGAISGWVMASPGGGIGLLDQGDGIGADVQQHVRGCQPRCTGFLTLA